ncbi:MAG: glycine dehydrogenase, partial [bacterium]
MKTANQPPPYLSLTDEQRQLIQNRLGVANFSELERDIPEDLREEYSSDLPGETETRLRGWFKEQAEKNRNTEELTCFLGGGVYDHHVPSPVKDMLARDGFLTSYTPYQPEVNQGSLQVMYEFQTMISEIMGLPVTNASMYDGATAFAEAVMMAVNVSRRDKVYYSPLLFPAWLEVLKSYAQPHGWELEALPVRNSRACIPDSWTGEPPAAVCLGYPNRLGCADEVEKWAHARPDEKTVGIAGVNPLALALLKSPGELEFDVAVGEGQPL